MVDPMDETPVRVPATKQHLSHATQPWPLMVQSQYNSYLEQFWNYCYDAWITRNQALKGHDQQSRQIARLHQAQYRIGALYVINNKCSRFAQSQLFYSSPEEHFRSVHSRSAWSSLMQPKNRSLLFLLG
jgi:hypothetical protein